MILGEYGEVNGEILHKLYVLYCGIVIGMRSIVRKPNSKAHFPNVGCKLCDSYVDNISVSPVRVN